MKHLITMAAAMLLAALSAAAHAQPADKKALTLEDARRVAGAAAAEARKHGAGGVIAVVDDGGNLMYLERLDNTFAAGANISIGKARTAALFKKPTKTFEDIVNKGRTTMVALPDFTPLQGGVPIEYEGAVIGAVGVSGAMSAQQDEELAIAGARVLQQSQATAGAPITFFESKQVDAAFAKGAPLLETPQYKVHASRREAPGQAEVHVLETDVIHVLAGSALFVTGGEVVDPKESAPNEIRGSAIRGGREQRIARGDVVVVPAGTPHWFKEVKGPVLYFVVKPIAQEGAQ